MSVFGSQPKPSPFSLNISTNTSQPQQTQSNLFGSYGQPQQQTANNASQQNQSGGLFGASSAQPQINNLFGGLGQKTQHQQVQGPQQQPQASKLGASQPLWQPPNSMAPREKTIPEQMQTLLEKWSPESAKCSFQYYFYNRVPPEHVPYYGPSPEEDEKKWEEALSKKPSEGDIPVLAKGFAALGNRLKIQVQSVQALQARLHEINNSLTAQLQKHDLEISVRTADARRRHVALSQRTLNLATKVQILRNRGYALDSNEESLKTKLVDLEKSAFDPILSGREEEIWARMVGVRERARFLQEETEKAGARMDKAQVDVFDENVQRQVTKILNDYDSQILHLQKEVDEIKKDFTEWGLGSDAP